MQLLADRRIARMHARALASVNESAHEAIKPWEDVFMGLAAAHAARDLELAAVHMGCAPRGSA